MPFQIIGCFSVTDHLARNAFVADVLLYDQLVIPVPDAKERERWEDLGRQPDVLDAKLEILEQPSRRHAGTPIVQRLAWTEQFRAELDYRYPEQRRALRELERDQFEPVDRIGSAEWMQSHITDRNLVADTVPIDPDRAEIVPAYPSFETIDADLKPALVEVSQPTPGEPLVGALGWELFVPDDPTLDADGLLDEAVNLAQDKNFRKKRAAFHEWRRGTAKGWSTKRFRYELEERLDEYKELTTRTKVRTTPRHVVALLAVGAPIAGLLVAPVVGVAAGATFALTRIGMDLAYKVPSIPERTQAVAMFHDARRRLQDVPPPAPRIRS
jgi:hypothetical protein